MSQEDIVPVGSYRAVAVPISVDGVPTWAQFGRSGKKGTPQVCVNFAILDGDWAGYRVYWIGYFATDKTEKRAMESLRLCGWTGDDLATAQDGPLDQEVQIVTEHNEYDGKVEARVAWVNVRGGGGGLRIAPMEAKDFRGFVAQMRAKAKAISAVTGEKAPPPPVAPAPPAPPAQPAVDDEIPF